MQNRMEEETEPQVMCFASSSYPRAQASRVMLSGWCPCIYIYKYYTKYSTLPSGISAYIVLEVGIIPEAGGRGKYSLPRVQYMPIFHKEGF